MGNALLRRCRLLLVTAMLCVHALVAHATPENGWWWNPGESGRGFFIEVQGDVLVMAAYFYEEDGRSTWLLSAGPIAAPNFYSGRLLSFSNGQTLFGAYKPPAGPVDQGEITLAFGDDTHATLTWPGGEIAIERQVIGGRTPDFDPTGWWWNPNESGRGLGLEIRDQTMFVSGFMYDDAGNPVWYISAGPMDTPTRYHGALSLIAGGQTMSGEYQAPTSSIPVGNITIEFTSADDATITLDDAGAAATRSSGARKAAPITRFYTRQNRPPRPPRPPTLAYEIVLEGPIYRAIVSNNPIVGQQALTVFESRRIVWLQTTNTELAPLAPYNEPGWIYFQLYEGGAPLKLTYVESNLGCVTTGTVNYPLLAGDGHLYLNLATKQYVGQIDKGPFGILDLKTVCGNFSFTHATLFNRVGFKFTGTASVFESGGNLHFNLAGDEPRVILDSIGFHTEVNGAWRFTQTP